MTTIGKWIDSGISMELIFNINPGVYWEDPNRKISGGYIGKVIYKAWKEGAKTVYYIRTVQKKHNSDVGCTTCAN